MGELHKTLTFHYNQYTQLQQLPPVQQQEKHQEMTYHYTQYSVMYKQYQEQQALKKKKVIKKPKVVDSAMQYLKLQRVFLMTQPQQKLFSDFHSEQYSIAEKEGSLDANFANYSVTNWSIARNVIIRFVLLCFVLYIQVFEGIIECISRVRINYNN